MTPPPPPHQSPPPLPRTLHGVVVMPPPVEGSPADIPPMPADALMPTGTMLDPAGPWWEPGPADIARALGWRWFIILGIAGLLVGLVALVIVVPGAGANLAGQAKFLLFLIGGGVSIALFIIRKLVRERTDMFCIHCGYSLETLGEVGRCPECGRPYHKSIVAEYRKDPHFFRERQRQLRRLPAPGAAILAGEFPSEDDGTR